MVQDTVEREVIYSQPIERVWAALTEPERMRQWFCNAGAEIDLRPGGEASFKWDHGTSRAIVETVDPPRQFAFRWTPGYKGEDPNRPLAEQPLTLVAFTLEPVDGGTRLRLVESGFAGLDESRRIAAFQDNDKGWDECLANLTNVLEADGGR
jgi:uncharacterized protein YndB with AHSA1/START domain